MSRVSDQCPGSGEHLAHHRGDRLFGLLALGDEPVAKCARMPVVDDRRQAGM